MILFSNHSTIYLSLFDESVAILGSQSSFKMLKLFDKLFDPIVHICIICKRWSLILGCFFPVSILNLSFKLSKWVGASYFSGNQFLYFRPQESKWIFTIVNSIDTSTHRHKERKDSLETRTIYIETSLVSWSLPEGPKHRGSILRNIASSEGDQLLAGVFLAIMDKIEADMFQIAKRWN